jgi:ADP-ribose pyrophosphatase
VGADGGLGANSGLGDNPAWSGEIRDAWQAVQPSESAVVWHGYIYDVASHTIEVGGETVRRELTLHPGAVSVMCINDVDEVLLLRQYRHPVGGYLFEPPAGLMDVSGETPLAAAKRELQEEAGLQAQQWNVLIDYHNSPGGSTEAHRIFLARGLSAHELGKSGGDGAEENEMTQVWVKIDLAEQLAAEGAFANPAALIGIFALAYARRNHWTSLQPGETSWQARERLASTGRLPSRG